MGEVCVGLLPSSSVFSVQTYGQTSVSFSLVGPPTTYVVMDLPMSVEVRATATGRSLNPTGVNGMSYLSRTSQNPFESNLPRDLTGLGALKEVLLDLDPSHGDVDNFDFLTFSNCFNGALNPPACL